MKVPDLAWEMLRLERRPHHIWKPRNWSLISNHWVPSSEAQVENLLSLSLLRVKLAASKALPHRSSPASDLSESRIYSDRVSTEDVNLEAQLSSIMLDGAPQYRTCSSQTISSNNPQHRLGSIGNSGSHSTSTDQAC